MSQWLCITPMRLARLSSLNPPYTLFGTSDCVLRQMPSILTFRRSQYQASLTPPSRWHCRRTCRWYVFAVLISLPFSYLWLTGGILVHEHQEHHHEEVSGSCAYDAESYHSNYLLYDIGTMGGSKTFLKTYTSPPTNQRLTRRVFGTSIDLSMTWSPK